MSLGTEEGSHPKSMRGPESGLHGRKAGQRAGGRGASGLNPELRAQRLMGAVTKMETD